MILLPNQNCEAPRALYKVMSKIKRGNTLLLLRKKKGEKNHAAADAEKKPAKKANSEKSRP